MNRRVLEQLHMVFGTFVMFSILSHVILVFPKHSNFRMFWCNSRRNHANRKSKTIEDLWRLWEDHEWRFKRSQKTLQREELYSQIQRHLILKQTPKKTKKQMILYWIDHPCALGMEKYAYAPAMHLAHAGSGPGTTFSTF